jgi:hypothetical protein
VKTPANTNTTPAPKKDDPMVGTIQCTEEVSCPVEPEESGSHEWGTRDSLGEAVFGFGTAGLACLTFRVVDEAEVVFAESIRNWSATTMNLAFLGLNGCVQEIGTDCNHHAHGYS